MNSAIFSDPDFDVEKYTRAVFRSNTISHVQSLRSNLDSQLSASASQLQQCVFANYSVFIATSNEMSNMESDLASIEGKLNEMYNLLVPLKLEEVQTEHEHEPDLLSAEEQDEESEDDISDLFDIALSRRDFEQCVEFVEEGLSDRKMEQVTSVMLDELKLSGSSRLVSLLTKCGKRNEARDAFLESKADWFNIEVSRIKFSGDACSFAEELSFLCFSAIRSTCNDYFDLFTEASDSSFLVAWASELVTQFTSLMNGQVFATADFGSLAKCVAIAHEECKTLTRKGISLTFHLGKLFHPFVEERIKIHMQELAAKLVKTCAVEQWAAKQMVINDGAAQQRVLRGSSTNLSADEASDLDSTLEYRTHIVHLTDSGTWLYSVMNDLVMQMRRLTFDLYGMVVEGIINLLRVYFTTQLNTRIVPNGVRDKQAVAIIATAVAVMNDLVPRIERQVNTRIGSHLGPVVDNLAIQFVNTRAQMILKEKLAAPTTNPESSSSSAADAAKEKAKVAKTQADAGADHGEEDHPKPLRPPLEPYVQLLNYLAKLGELVASVLPDDFAASIMRSLADAIWEGLPSGTAEPDAEFVRCILGVDGDIDDDLVHPSCQLEALEPAYLSLKRLLVRY
eukprot:ANDGO_08181.mRNA.1 Exocyst complex component 8